MKCIKCERDIPDNSLYCNLCGKKQVKERGEPRKHKRRANGEGSVFPLPNGKYRADKTLCYVRGEDNGWKRKTRSRTFIKRSDAILWLQKKEDKLALIGHTESEQLRDYQDVNYADLRKITDNI